MKVYVGADHRGVEFKEKIKAILKKLGYETLDQGTNDPQISCDYPEVAYKVAHAVAQSKGTDRGILVCMSGIGQAIAANKVRGAYAALCYNAQAAVLSRQHNNANVLVLGAKFVDPNELESLIKSWLTTDFEGGRHQNRIDKIKDIEQGKSF